ncbi:MAG: polysaccharide pyruvyl transferase family protein [Candidatus Eremiobacteraeota bacterium]|nr:polysaccharide pyruvyl transferase family protein [Candidatus Eremiobacteraeota bacterium]MBC5827289.1 polysaccharide pyruvyl transferase family protein [Candidatus Eremiobacteraeota bacterium]
MNDRATAVLATLLKPGTRCALLDFPDYSNVGDHAVWLGQRRLLRKLGVEIVYTASQFTFSQTAMRRVLGDGVILLQGGGNFGDLWPRHQKFRETIIASFPNNRIVQLPQSIQFTGDANRERAKEIVGRHRHFTLLVRDGQSLITARRHFDVRSEICPDLAMGMGTLSPPGLPRAAVLWLYRTDKECREPMPSQLPDGHQAADWIAHDNSRATLVRRFAAGKLNHLYPLWGSAVLTAQLSLFDAISWRHVERGLSLLRRGRIIVTNRLHGHILSLMSDIPHVVVGDRYGKIRNLYESWTSQSPLAHFAKSPEEALKMAAGLAVRSA